VADDACRVLCRHGVAYYCSDECLHSDFTDEEWAEECENNARVIIRSGNILKFNDMANLATTTYKVQGHVRL
jgi:hypothetical protein